MQLFWYVQYTEKRRGTQEERGLWRPSGAKGLRPLAPEGLSPLHPGLTAP